MIVNRLNKKPAVNQAKFTREGAVMAKWSFIHDLVREHATPGNGSLELDIFSLADYEQKILLAHFCDAGEYEDALECESTFKAIFKEYRLLMQEAVDNACTDEYHEAMQEAGGTKRYHSDNGEWYYS